MPTKFEFFLMLMKCEVLKKWLLQIDSEEFQRMQMTSFYMLQPNFEREGQLRCYISDCRLQYVDDQDPVQSLLRLLTNLLSLTSIAAFSGAVRRAEDEGWDHQPLLHGWFVRTNIPKLKKMAVLCQEFSWSNSSTKGQ